MIRDECVTPVKAQAKQLGPNTPQNTVSKTANPQSQHVDILARTIWGEARGEGLTGQEAVACVVLNRLQKAQRRRDGMWWGNTILQICRKPYQFSCWNANDPNYLKLLKVDGNDKAFAVALRIARRAVAGILKDHTNGATHYHHKRILPNWAIGQIPVAEIGNHIFYRLEA